MEPYKVVTKKVVNRADNSIPPIITRARGALISELSPNPKAIGTSARDVMSVVNHDDPIVNHDSDKEDSSDKDRDRNIHAENQYRKNNLDRG
jgi:hypothetical protein